MSYQEFIWNDLKLFPDRDVLCLMFSNKKDLIGTNAIFFPFSLD